MFRKKSLLTTCYLLLATCGSIAAAHATAFPDAAPRAGLQPNPVPFSQYGTIQNVQSYSSNPFYNKDSPYNQRMPVPIYAQGTDIATGDCRAIVAYLVASECGRRNNCRGLRVMDIRPAVITGLSTMPGKNYMNECNGYIDSAFDDYMKTANIAGAGGVGASGFPAAFPAAGGGAATGGGRQLVMNNPLADVRDDWFYEIVGRLGEVNQLQAQNAKPTQIYAAQMPTTFDDLSFAEQIAVQREGLAPWRCDPKTGVGCAYQQVQVESMEDRFDREQRENRARARAEEEKNKYLQATDFCAWCERVPTDCFKSRVTERDDMNKQLQTVACSSWDGRSKKTIDNWNAIDTTDPCFKLKIESLQLTAAHCPEQAKNAPCTDKNGKPVPQGTQRDCTAERGMTGKEVCGTGGNWSKCTANPNEQMCKDQKTGELKHFVGTESDCTNKDGKEGTWKCQPGGTWSPCVVPAAPVASTTTTTTTPPTGGSGSGSGTGTGTKEVITVRVS